MRQISRGYASGGWQATLYKETHSPPPSGHTARKKGCDDEGMRSKDAKKCSRQEIGSAEWFFVRANRGTSLFWRSVTARDRAEDPSSESGGGERTWSRTRGKDETTGEGDRSRGGKDEGFFCDEIGHLGQIADQGVLDHGGVDGARMP